MNIMKRFSTQLCYDGCWCRYLCWLAVKHFFFFYDFLITRDTRIGVFFPRLPVSFCFKQSNPFSFDPLTGHTICEPVLALSVNSGDLMVIKIKINRTDKVCRHSRYFQKLSCVPGRFVNGPLDSILTLCSALVHRGLLSVAQHLLPACHLHQSEFFFLSQFTHSWVRLW